MGRDNGARQAVPKQHKVHGGTSQALGKGIATTLGMSTASHQSSTPVPTPLPLRAIVGTDLDATLLDDGYDLAAAAQCLDRWAETGVLVIPASSKTLIEMVALNALRRFPSPLIYENGAGVAWPTAASAGGAADLGNYQQELPQQDYASLCNLLQSWQANHGLASRGFHQLSAQAVAAATGLTLQGAEAAKQRQASEPILWQDSKETLALCAQAAQAQGLQLVRGGRFVHLMPKVDKGQALVAVASRYVDNAAAVKPLLVGLGDSPNDAAMLAVCDACAVFPQANGAYLPILNKPLARAAGPGPKHWHNALTALIGDNPS